MSTRFNFDPAFLDELTKDVEAKASKYLSMNVVDPKKLIIFTDRRHKGKWDNKDKNKVPDCIIDFDGSLVPLPSDYTKEQYQCYINLVGSLTVKALRPAKKKLTAATFNSGSERKPEISLIFSCGSTVQVGNITHKNAVFSGGIAVYNLVTPRLKMFSTIDEENPAECSVPSTPGLDADSVFEAPEGPIPIEQAQAPNPDAGEVQESDEKQAGCTGQTLSMFTECIRRKRKNSGSPGSSGVSPQK